MRMEKINSLDILNDLIAEETKEVTDTELKQRIAQKAKQIYDILFEPISSDYTEEEFGAGIKRLVD